MVTMVAIPKTHTYQRLSSGSGYSYRVGWSLEVGSTKRWSLVGRLMPRGESIVVMHLQWIVQSFRLCNNEPLNEVSCIYHHCQRVVINMS